MTMMIRLALLLLLALLPGLARAEPGDMLKRDGVWAQSYVDRPADPDVRFGQLANGMRYAIQHNTTPAERTSLRLLIGSGSLEERDDQQGLAHFLEHMAFRGSAHVPSGDMVRVLQRLGLSFGADTNAHTGLDETVYQFDLPRSDADTTGTGLMLLREIAGELTLAQTEMDPERGVVLSEERVRDGPSYRSGVAGLMFQMDGQLAPRRMPIGKVEIVRDAPVSLIREFYEAEYRPDNAVVVAVGSFDVDAMEAAIRARFADWTARTPAHPKPDLGQVAVRGPAVRVLAAPGTPLGLTLSWVAPPDNTADTAARAPRDVADLVAQGILNNRLQRLTQAENAPFLSASAGRGNVVGSAMISEFSVQPKPGAWQTALDAIIAAERSLATYGPRADEIARAETKLTTELRVAADGARTRPSSQIADALVRAAKENEVTRSPAQDLAEVEAILPALTASDISAAIQRLFAGSGPLVFLAGPDPVPGGEAAVSAALAAAMSRPVTQEEGEADKAWPYQPASPGAIASRTRIEDLGVSDIRFANGVRLIAKQTDFTRDEVMIWVRIGHGRLGISPDKARFTWMASGPIPLLVAGGTRELTTEDIQRLTAANRVGVRESLDDDAFLLTGTTRPADLDRQMQLMQAYTVAPGLRAPALARVRAAMLNRLPQLEASASGVFSRAAKVALHSGDPRFQDIPDAAALAAATPEDLAALIGPDFSAGPIEVTIVGDIDIDRAIDAVARSYGALPPRPLRAPPDPAAATLHVPAANGANPMVVPHNGRADQAMAMVAWQTDDFFADPQEQRSIATMAAILNSRLIDRLRVAQGVTYSPNVAADTSLIFKGYGVVDAVVETPVDKVPVFFFELDRIVEAMRNAPPTDDEMDRAKRPRVDQRIQVQRTNAYWVAALSEAHGDARQFDAIRALVPGTEKVTAADVQEAARRFLSPGGGFRMIVRPKAP